MKEEIFKDIQLGDVVLFNLENTSPYVGFSWGRSCKGLKESLKEHPKNFLGDIDCSDMYFCSIDPTGCTRESSPLQDRVHFLGLNLVDRTLGGDRVLSYQILRGKRRLYR